MSTNDFMDQVQEAEQRNDISSVERKESALEARVASLENQIRPLNEKVLGEKYATPVQPAPQVHGEETGRDFSMFDALLIAAALAVIVILVLYFTLPH